MSESSEEEEEEELKPPLKKFACQSFVEPIIISSSSDECEKEVT